MIEPAFVVQQRDAPVEIASNRRRAGDLEPHCAQIVMAAVVWLRACDCHREGQRRDGEQGGREAHTTLGEGAEGILHDGRGPGKRRLPYRVSASQLPAMSCRSVALVAITAGALGCSPRAERRAPSTDESPRAERRAPSTDQTPARNDSLLAVARAAYERTPENVDSIIWFGRRTAYLGAYDDAIAIYTRGLALHPDEPRLYRHRGHRYISTRRFADAIADFERAAGLTEGQPDEIEPDGLPNARNIPTSTLHSNIWYHLGLARYVTGDFVGARSAYERGMAVSTNPDMLTAMSYWLYLTQRRVGDTAAARRTLAAIRPDFDIIENHAYHRLMMLYQGRLPVDSVLAPADSVTLENVTTAYGVGMWHLLAGRATEAERIFRRVTAAPEQRAAFGYIAAEAELRR